MKESHKIRDKLKAWRCIRAVLTLVNDMLFASNSKSMHDSSNTWRNLV